MKRSRQQGTVLVVSLLVLIVMTILATNAIRETNLDLKIIGNMQSKQFVRNEVQSVIEQKISVLGTFTEGGVSEAIAAPGGYFNVTFEAPDCIDSRLAPGQSKGEDKDLYTGYDPVSGDPITLDEFKLLDNYDTLWELSGSGTDPVTNAQATIHQGITVTLKTSGNCS